MKMEKRTAEEIKVDKVVNELVDVAVKNELTLVELDQAYYKLRDYYNKNAVLKTEETSK